jgi:PAS domain-containing protein
VDNSELINVLESLLGPAVAGMSAPAPRARGTRTTGRPMPAERPVGPQDTPEVQRPVAQGSITALLSAEMPIGLAILDGGTMRVRRANASLLMLLGERWGEREVIGRPLSEIAPGLAHSEVEAAFQRVARTGQPFSAIVEEVHQAGAIYRRCTLSAIQRADGTYEDLLLTLLDVTDQMEARMRAEHETQRAEERAIRVEEQALRASVRSAAVQALARVSDLSDALNRVVERTAESLADCCMVFLLGEDDMLQMAALYHRDRVQGFRLRAAYADHPLRRGEGIVGQVVLSANGMLAAHWGPDELDKVADRHRALADEAHIESLACVPLREASRNIGALVLYSTQIAVAGIGRTFTGADLAFLQELADQVAQAVQNARLRDALRLTQAEKEAMLEACAEGIAIYDAQGRLRHLNAAGRRLLSRPVGPDAESPSNVGNVGVAPVRRSLLAPDGRPLEPEELPWSLALRGQRVGDQVPMRVTVEWTGELRRLLEMCAAPVYDSAANVAGAVVTFDEARRPDADAGMRREIATPIDASGGEAEWARWRETMELLDDGVVLCNTDGTAVFVNAAGRQLLNLVDDTAATQENHSLGHIWEHLRQLDGAPLLADTTPAALALAGSVVRGLETAVVLAGGAVRRVFWDARRIDRANGDKLGVVLIARAATEASPGGEAAEMVLDQPAAIPAQSLLSPLAPTTLLPGRVAHLDPDAAGAAPAGPSRDLAEACARVARAHEGTQGRRLEIRLPRRRVPVFADEATLERAVHVLIASAATALPASVALHVAVWVERSRDDVYGASSSPIPPAMDADQIKTVLISPGQMPNLTPPTRAVAPGHLQGASGSVAVVRICSPNVRVPVVEPEVFDECRTLVDQLGGRAWARDDPVLGPTYSFSLPLAEARG